MPLYGGASGGSQGWRDESMNSRGSWGVDETVPAAGIRRRGDAPKNGWTPWASHRTESIDDVDARAEMLARQPLQWQRQGAPWASDVTGDSFQGPWQGADGSSLGAGDRRGQDWNLLAKEYAQSFAVESQSGDTLGGGAVSDWASPQARGSGLAGVPVPLLAFRRR